MSTFTSGACSLALAWAFWSRSMPACLITSWYWKSGEIHRSSTAWMAMTGSLSRAARCSAHVNAASLPAEPLIPTTIGLFILNPALFHGADSSASHDGAAAPWSAVTSVCAGP